MITCIIVDDEPLAQDVVEHYITRTKQLQLIKKCDNALEAFDILHKHKIDIIFLDIKMPGMNGLDFIRSLKNPPRIIFTTAYAEHAVTGFELEAIDYLLKPFTFERFTKALEKFLKISPPEKAEEKEYTYFKVSGQLVKVLHTELIYAQGVKDYIKIHTVNKDHLIHMTMKYLNELLPASGFIRVHRSFIVNKKFITAIATNSVTLSVTELPVGDSYKNKITLLKRDLIP